MAETVPTIQERLREEIRQFHEGTCYGERPPAEDSGLLEVFQMETGWQAAALIDSLIKERDEAREKAARNSGACVMIGNQIRALLSGGAKS